MNKATKFLNRVYLKLKARVYGFIGRMTLVSPIGMRENEKSYVGLFLGIIGIVAISGILYVAVQNQVPTWMSSIFSKVTDAIN